MNADPEEDDMESFEINDRDLEFALNPGGRRGLSKNQQLYGIWADREDSDEEEEENLRSGFGSSSRRRKNDSAPVSFVSGGIKHGNKIEKEANEPQTSKDDDSPIRIERRPRTSKRPQMGGNVFAGLRSSAVHSTVDPEKFLDWAKHSKSEVLFKMMHKMGYTPGQGLGANKQGIVEPVQAVLRPGRAAVGAYGKESKGPKFGESSAETQRRSGTAVEEIDESEGVIRKGNWKKSGTKKTLSYQFKTIDEVIAEGGTLKKRLEVSSGIKVIDMTGKEQKVYSGYEAYAAKTRAVAESEKEHRAFDVPELGYNLNALLDLTEESIRRNTHQLTFLQDQTTALENDRNGLKIALSKERDEQVRMKEVLALLEGCRNSCSEASPTGTSSRSVEVNGQSAKVLRSRQIGFEGQILSRLFSDYDQNTRPPVRDSAEHPAIVVITSLFINQIRWNNQEAEVDLYLRQQWEDSRLSYEVDSREGVEEVVVPSNQHLWEPDTYFANANEHDRGTRKRTVVEPSGFVRATEMRAVTVPIQYGLQFPFVNTKTFKLRLSSYNYPIEDIVYLWANSPPTVVPVEVSEELLDSPYEFTEAIAEDCVGNYTVGVYSCISVTVTFSGSASEALFKIFIPSIFLIMASWLHFWVHGSWSVPRTVSAALPFFVFATFLVFYPQPYLSTEGMGGVQVWLLFCLIITFLSLVEYFVVICCGIRRTVRYPNGSLTEAEAPIVAVRDQMEVVYGTKCANFKQNNGVDIIARILFPLVFLIFLIVFLILYLI